MGRGCCGRLWGGACGVVGVFGRLGLWCLMFLLLVWCFASFRSFLARELVLLGGWCGGGGLGVIYLVVLLLLSGRCGLWSWCMMWSGS